MEGVFVWHERGFSGWRGIILKGAADPVLELLPHFFIMELATVDEGGDGVFFLGNTGTFQGDEGGNSEGDINWKVVTPDELLPPFAGCH
eukprot:12146410-Ditylum_brightwellii.AAC.1